MERPGPEKTLVTVARVGRDIRISKVDRHGETVIVEPDMETKALAVLLWGKLSKGEVADVGEPLLPWDHINGTLNRLSGAIEKMTSRLDANTHALTVAQTQQQAAKPTPAPRGQ